MTGLSTAEGSTRVLLRILSTRDEDLNIEFRRQVDMFHRVRHANLVAVLGCCRDSPDFQMILMESHPYINLKSHLLSTSSSSQPPWSVAQIQSATIQIARGMNALAEARFVHRDLGTRNILVAFHGKDNTKVYTFKLYSSSMGDLMDFRNFVGSRPGVFEDRQLRNGQGAVQQRLLRLQAPVDRSSLAPARSSVGG